MKPLLAAVILVRLAVGISGADDTPLQPSTLTPDKDVRLVNLTGADPQKIGVLTYYPNVAGGVTFMEGEDIVFYAVPYMAARCQLETTVQGVLFVNGKPELRRIPVRTNVFTIGTSKMPLAGQTIYRGEMKTHLGVPYRQDAPIAKWTRDTPNGKGRLSIMAEDNETRLKLKSIVPVLELLSE
jgi:hypothetical protein